MKLTKYTLNRDGTIPKHIVDGGYFSKLNGKPSPQDHDFIGITNNDTDRRKYGTKLDFETEVKLNNDLTDDASGETLHLQDQINNIWGKVPRNV